MAEKVQAILDRMVPALKDLLDKEVFTESEIKAIVARRRESEYLLCRRSARKTDFLRYIEAEKNLERLRSLRNKKLLARKAAQEREAAKKSSSSSTNDQHSQIKAKKSSSSSIGDASIVQHIHLLYVRAKRKWKDELSFHLQHAEFAKEKKSYSMLSKIYAEALQIHPRNSGLWIEAASHEYFGYATVGNELETTRGGSVRNARVLLQRGLRVNQTSQDLWLQSFCLELHYIQKLRGRKEILKIGQDASKHGTDDDGDKRESREEDKDEEEVQGEELNALIENAKLPRIIYTNAIKAIPRDVMFRVKFVEQCKLFPQTKFIVDEIMQSIEEDFGNVEEAWISRARIAVDFGMDSENRIGFMP